MYITQTTPSMNPIRRSAIRLNRLIAVAFIVALLASLLPIGTDAAESQASVQAEVYFESTGQTLGGAFYDGWELRGGMADAGAPISPMIQTETGWSQWFEFTRLDIGNPAIDQAVGEDARVATIGDSLTTLLGMRALHPAFRPYRGSVGANVRSFANGHTLANAFLNSWQDAEMSSRLGLPISQEFRVGKTVYQVFEHGALSWHPDFGVNIVPLGVYDAVLNGQLRLSGDQPEGVPTYDDGTIDAAPSAVAGAGGAKWIDINLSSYTLTAFEGQTPVYSTYIVDGAAEYPTVRGSFAVYSKLDSQTMRGFNTDGSEYLTEDVPYVMYFYSDFAIHGAYWRSSFGYSGSHGCINAPVGDAAWLYSWADYGTPVEVHD